jgi:alpha-beta hydrolase superfamily lysophospholipase
MGGTSLGATVRMVLLAATLAAVAPACGRDEPPAPPAGARTISIEGPAGRLDAVEIGEGDRVVLLSHGATGTKEGFYPLLPALADAGYRAIAYDARGVGGSEGNPDATTRADDLAAVVGFARGSGASSIALGGASLGAAVTLQEARTAGADAVIALSPAVASSSGIADRLQGIPVFIAVAESNEPFTTQARSLGDALGVEPVVVTGDRHGTGLFVDHPELVDEIVDFLATTR